MGDFLGSYYDSADLDGTEVDEKVISQRMALLSAEQPVSVMEMDNLESVQRPARGRDLTALRQTVDQLHATNESNVLREKFSSDDGLGEDLDIPVASMSTFEQGQPSMVSVQLMSVQGEGFQRWQPGAGAVKPIPSRTTVAYKREESRFSQLPDAQLAQSSVKRTRGTLEKRSPRREVTFVDEEKARVEPGEDEKSIEQDKPSRKNSLFRFLSRKHDYKVKNKRK